MKLSPSTAAVDRSQLKKEQLRSRLHLATVIDRSLDEVTPDDRPPLAALAVRVLVADDQAESRDLLARQLSRCGYKVTEVGDGEELLQALAGHEYELVISDLQMPGVSGLDALKRLRGTDWVTPFILMTGFGDATTHQVALSLGATHVFHKPLDLRHLVEIARGIVASR